MEPSKKGVYYPEDLTDEEFDSLPANAKETNTIIVRKDGKIEIIPFEVYFKDVCVLAAEKLRKARPLCPNASFQLYLDAKISELLLGTPKSRHDSDALWIMHDYHVDLVLSTALEVYLDGWKNLKGQPTGAVYILNKSLSEFVKQIDVHAPIMEREGPSIYFRKDARATSKLVLRPVDVLNWSSDYCTSPMTTIAQCLPNDEEMKKNLGAVNLIYLNTNAAIENVNKQPASKMFIPSNIYDQIRPVYSMGSTIHSMLHEIGHTTGQCADPEKANINPEQIFGNEYNALEELRAELFGMYGVMYCKQHGLISHDLALAAHYALIISTITALQFAPVQAHQKARNIIFHWFKSKGALECIKEEGDVLQADETFKKEEVTKFRIVEEKLSDALLSLLRKVQDIKSLLDKQGLLFLFLFFICILFVLNNSCFHHTQLPKCTFFIFSYSGAEELRKEYCFADNEFKLEVKRRLTSSCRGRGFIFPRLVAPSSEAPAGAAESASKFALPGGWKLVYPASFVDQPKINISTH